MPTGSSCRTSPRFRSRECETTCYRRGCDPPERITCPRSDLLFCASVAWVLSSNTTSIHPAPLAASNDFPFPGQKTATAFPRTPSYREQHQSMMEHACASSTHVDAPFIHHGGHNLHENRNAHSQKRTQ